MQLIKLFQLAEKHRIVTQLQQTAAALRFPSSILEKEVFSFLSFTK